jgi:carbon monoxide dehydrogenase subunit G
MEMHGEYRIPAPRETVWEALNDPEVLKACIPGCESLETNDVGGFDATVKAKVGPVKATFKGSVVLENVNAPESYTITGEGKGGAAGFAKGGADVKLVEDGAETVLTYTVNAQVGGKLAQIGGRLIDSTAKKYANDFFGKFVEIVTARAGGAPDPAPEPASEPPSPIPAPPSPKPAAATDTDTGAATPEETVRRDATTAAIEAVDRTKAARKGMSPMRWILILAIVLLGLTLFFGGGPMTPGGN